MRMIAATKMRRKTGSKKNDNSAKDEDEDKDNSSADKK
jgi:hypothetical protein